MPSDLACCLDGACPMKQNCLRFLTKASSPYQWYADFQRKGKSCEYQILTYQNELPASR
jgi:hypothetical protein